MFCLDYIFYIIKYFPFLSISKSAFQKQEIFNYFFINFILKKNYKNIKLDFKLDFFFFIFIINEKIIFSLNSS